MKTRFISLSIKINLAILLIVLLTVPTTGILYMKRLSSSLEKEGRAKQVLIKEGLTTKGTTLVNAVSGNAKIAVAELSYTELQTIIEQIKEADQDVVFVSATSGEGLVYAHTDRQRIGKRESSEQLSRALAATQNKIFEYPVRLGTYLEVVGVFYLDEDNTEKGGVIRLAFSLARLERIQQTTHATIEEEIDQALTLTALVTGFLAFIGILLGVFISGRIARPVRHLTRIAETIAAGRLDIRVDAEGTDEIGRLANSFEQMRLAIHQKLTDLESIFETSKSLAATMDLTPMLETGYQAIARRIGVRTGAVYVWNLEDETLSPYAAFSEFEDPSGHEDVDDRFRKVLSTGLACQSARHATTVLHPASSGLTGARSGTDESVPEDRSDLLCVPLAHQGRVFGVMSLSNRAEEGVYTEEDVSFAETIATTMSITWSNVEMLAATRERARLQAELATAHAVQEALFPDADPEFPGWDIAGYIETASQTGGDWYGFIDAPDGSRIVVVGDVTGHGVPAALVTAGVASACGLLERLARQGIGPVLTPKSVLQYLDKTVRAVGHGRYAMTMFALAIDSGDEVRFSNAGHNFPLHAKAIDTRKRPGLLMARGERLGYRNKDEESVFEERSALIATDDVLILYTDGLLECTNESDQEFGLKRLIRSLAACRTGSPAEIRQAILTAAREYFGDTPLKDDLTLVVLKRTAPGSTRLKTT